jgi:hypothetical protein
LVVVATLACLAPLLGAVASNSGELRGLDDEDTSFTFTAAGDYASTLNTMATLQAIGRTNPAFHLALGDLSYAPGAPEAEWCQLVRSQVGPDLRFQLLTGNHEDFNIDPINGLGGNIDNFARCLPNHMATMQGTYARDYYFDFPDERPVARFILLSPEMAFEGPRYQSYAPGSALSDWVSNLIDDARAAGISWIIAGMHVNCITMGTNSCGPRARDVMDLLVAKNVDLILQGHDHNYQRSKLLTAPNDSCPSIVPDEFNAGCVAEDGADNIYSRGLGSVLVIVGTGGAALSDVNAGDPEAPYFARWMGRNVGNVHGFLRVELTQRRLAAAFEPTTEGDFSDAFSIERR